MKLIIRELDRYHFEARFKGIPELTYDVEQCTVPEDVNIIVHNPIAVEETKDKLTRVSFGCNKIHPYTVDLDRTQYYQIEIF